MGPIVVIGSINMDLVCRVRHMPKPGQTVIGNDFVTIPGGKGANQAVAAAKLGASVQMIGRVGNDDFGQRLLNGLKHHQVGTGHVTITEGASSGVATILVDRKGENSIVVAPGANHRLTPADIDAAKPIIASASAVLMQLEIPLETVRHAIAVCQEMGVFTILDPAPAPEKPLPRAMFGVDVLTPNQSEVEQLLGVDQKAKVKRKRLIEPKQMASNLLARGARSVVLKLGSKGAVLVSREAVIRHVKPFRVKVVDSTAAGDAFTAALAVAHGEGKSLIDAVRFANAAGALCCTGFGAQPSLPSRAEVERLFSR